MVPFSLSARAFLLCLPEGARAASKGRSKGATRDTAGVQCEAQEGQMPGVCAAARHMPQAAMYQAYIYYCDINGFYELSGTKQGHSAGMYETVLRQALAAFLPLYGAKISLNEQNSGI